MLTLRLGLRATLRKALCDARLYGENLYAKYKILSGYLGHLR